MKVIGLDIGTTTICTVVLNGKTGEIIEKLVADNNSFITTEHTFEKIQDASIILHKAREMVDRLLIKHEPVGCIGLTGQMHGILYIDKYGNAISPLYTWQDGRGDLAFNKHISYAEYISDRTGYKVATGYGIVTHFYNFYNKIIPEDACYFCTIHDYVAMKLTSGNVPMINNTNAASLGLFDLENNCFDNDAINKIGLNEDFFPKVVSGAKQIGKTVGNITVVVAIGDNQASFIGSARNMKDSVLINIGTGSQISLLSKNYMMCSETETRPCIENDFIMVGSSLCGGRAYALLEKFFNTIVSTATGGKCNDMYSIMGKMAKEAITLEDKLKITTTFSGTRQNPYKRGKVENLSVDNFTPEYFTLGILDGIVNELFEMYNEIEKVLKEKPTMLIGSGNGMRQNPILQKMFSEKFDMPVKIPLHKEEASYGAALFALIGIGYFKDLEEAQSLIRYQGE